MQLPETSDNSGFIQKKEALTTKSVINTHYTSIFHDGSNRIFLCGSDSGRQAASKISQVP